MQDLWAEFTGDALPKEDTGHSGGLRQHRRTEQATLTALRAWLLRAYILPYGASLGTTRIFRRCYWIDGLGHANAATRNLTLPVSTDAPETTKNPSRRPKIQPDAPSLPGALQPVEEIAQQLALLARPITLYGLVLANRNGKQKVADEQALTGNGTGGALTVPKESCILPGTWPEIAPQLLPALEQSAAVFLLNPLKDGLFRYSDMTEFYQRAAPTELFLWLSHKQIETQLLPGLRTTEGAAALTNLLRSDRWKALLAREGSSTHPEQLIQGLIGLLVESMRPHFLSVQRLAFPFRVGPATVEEGPYSLLFATRRQDSLASLNNAVCQRERLLIAESQQGILNETWFTAQREEQASARIATLTQEILALGRRHRPRRWPDLRQQLLLAHFGEYTLQDYDQVIIALLARGEVRCEWRKLAQEVPQETEVRPPGNDDLLLWKEVSHRRMEGRR